MSETLFDKLARLHAQGRARAPLAGLVDPRAAALTTFRPASVLVAITDRPPAGDHSPGPGMIMIHRPETMRKHPGQIAFPGGGRDPGEDAVAAALREADEELGIPPEAVRVVGTGDLLRTGSGYDITPVIAVIPPDLPLGPSPEEVADWFELPIDHALDPGRHGIEILPAHAPFDGRRTIRIDWGDRRIWGITAMILSGLAYRLAWTEAAAEPPR